MKIKLRLKPGNLVKVKCNYFHSSTYRNNGFELFKEFSAMEIPKGTMGIVQHLAGVYASVRFFNGDTKLIFYKDLTKIYKRNK